MPSKYGTFVSDFLEAVSEATGLFPWPIFGSRAWVRKQWQNRSKKTIYNTARNLQKQGWVEVAKKNGREFLRLTQKGELELLMRKAALGPADEKKWDGQWRVIIFDIPEKSYWQRNLFRRLLKQNGFVSLQASVFVSPYPLNRQAIDYLKISGLIKFIRFLRVAEIDDDVDLKKKFKL